MGLCSKGLIMGRIFVSEIWGTYFLDGLFSFSKGLIIGILRYMSLNFKLFSKKLQYFTLYIPFKKSQLVIFPGV